MRNRHLYPAEWHSLIRPQALVKAKFKCSDCGIKQRAYGYYDLKGKFVECDEFMKVWALKHGFKPHRIHLAVCHLNQTPSDCSEDNLSVKCPKCHFRYDKEMNRLTRLANNAHR